MVRRLAALMRSVRLVLCGIAVVLLILAVLPSAVAAQEEPENPIGMEAGSPSSQLMVTLDQLQLSDQTVRGLFPSFDAWIPPPGGDIGEDAVFDLHYIPSPLLRHPSTLTVSVNDAAVWAVDLDVTEGMGGQRSERIVVPKKLLQSDFNHVHLRFLLRLPEDDCQVQDHPGRYVTILNTSGMRFTPSGRAADRKGPDLLGFPAPFVLSGEPSAVPITFIVPTDAQRQHYSVAAQVAARLGRAAREVGTRLRLHAASDVTAEKLAAGHLILIGTPAELPLMSQAIAKIGFRQRRDDSEASSDGSGQWFTEEGLLAQARDGLVGVGPSPWNPTYALLAITGNTPETLAKAGQALAVRSIGGNAAGTLAVVPHFPEFPAQLTAGEVEQLTMRLSDLGQQDRTAEGTGTHQTGVTFRAGTPDPNVPATLDLNFVHSPVIDRHRSSVTVKINDTNVGGVNLAESETGNASTRMSIPVGLLREGENRLSIDFVLYRSLLPECGPMAEERAWATLLSSTSLTIPQATTKQPQGQLDLAAYPAPFVQSRAVTDVALLLPEDSAERIGALAVAADLGRRARVHVGGLQAGLVDQFAGGDLRSLHVVAYGTVAGNSTLAQIAREAPVRLADVARPIDAVGLLGITRSPWQRERVLLYVTAADALALPATVLALEKGPLAGTLVIVDREGRAVPEALGAPPETLVTAEQGIGLTLGIAIGVGMLSLALLDLHIYRRVL
ncbi:MAG: hypothetical protein CL878_11155 [Dehalococcoidia bacterium]|nr:hypothetical protein [Dehalococcoidia bacterium]